MVYQSRFRAHQALLMLFIFQRTIGIIHNKEVDHKAKQLKALDETQSLPASSQNVLKQNVEQLGSMLIVERPSRTDRVSNPEASSSVVDLSNSMLSPKNINPIELNEMESSMDSSAALSPSSVPHPLSGSVESSPLLNLPGRFQEPNFMSDSISNPMPPPPPPGLMPQPLQQPYAASEPTLPQPQPFSPEFADNTMPSLLGINEMNQPLNQFPIDVNQPFQRPQPLNFPFGLNGQPVSQHANHGLHNHSIHSPVMQQQPNHNAIHPQQQQNKGFMPQGQMPTAQGHQHVGTLMQGTKPQMPFPAHVNALTPKLQPGHQELHPPQLSHAGSPATHSRQPNPFQARLDNPFNSGKFPLNSRPPFPFGSAGPFSMAGFWNPLFAHHSPPLPQPGQPSGMFRPNSGGMPHNSGFFQRHLAALMAVKFPNGLSNPAGSVPMRAHGPSGINPFLNPMMGTLHNRPPTFGFSSARLPHT